MTFLGCDPGTFKSRKEKSAWPAQNSGKAGARRQASRLALTRSARVCVRAGAG